MPDAFSALRLLSTHPNIDAKRIGFIGFSRGGVIAIAIIQDRFRKEVLGESDLKFAIAVATYPTCEYTFYSATPGVTPLRIYLAGKDDWVGTSQCTTYADFLRAKGCDVQVKIYEEKLSRL